MMKLHLPQTLVTLAFVAVQGSAMATAAEVVVYTSVDDVFARPVAEQFTKDTGIEVRLVPDTEETKSTGLLNRMIAEKNRPQADVFWSGDPVRAAVLKLKGIAAAYRPAHAKDLPTQYSDPDGYWTGFSARVRVILYNTQLIPKDRAPISVFDLATAPDLHGKACIANPLFGTTSMQAAALFIALGDKGARDYFAGLTRNGVKMVSSNGEVRRRVAEGDCSAGIADSDDAHEAIKDRKSVAVVYPDEGGIGTLVVPNAAVLIAGGPNSESGKRFIDYLLTPQTERALAESDAAQIPLLPNVATPPGIRTIDKVHAMQVDYTKLASKLDELSRGFLRQWAAENNR